MQPSEVNSIVTELYLTKNFQEKCKTLFFVSPLLSLVSPLFSESFFKNNLEAMTFTFQDSALSKMYL